MIPIPFFKKQQQHQQKTAVTGKNSDTAVEFQPQQQIQWFTCKPQMLAPALTLSCVKIQSSKLLPQPQLGFHYIRLFHTYFKISLSFKLIMSNWCWKNDYLTFLIRPETINSSLNCPLSFTLPYCK